MIFRATRWNSTFCWLLLLSLPTATVPQSVGSLPCQPGWWHPGLSWDVPGVPPPDFFIESDEPGSSGFMATFSEFRAWRSKEKRTGSKQQNTSSTLLVAWSPGPPETGGSRGLHISFSVSCSFDWSVSPAHLGVFRAFCEKRCEKTFFGNIVSTTRIHAYFASLLDCDLAPSCNHNLACPLPPTLLQQQNCNTSSKASRLPKKTAL